MIALSITEEDVDSCGDWLTKEAAKKFIDNDCTHVKCDGITNEAEVITFEDGTKGVLLGEDV